MEEALIRQRVEEILNEKAHMGAGMMDPRMHELHNHILRGGFSKKDIKRYLDIGLDLLFPEDHHRRVGVRAGAKAGVTAGVAKRKQGETAAQKLFAKRSKRVAKLMDMGYSREKAWKAVMDEQKYQAKKAKLGPKKRKAAGVAY